MKLLFNTKTAQISRFGLFFHTSHFSFLTSFLAFLHRMVCRSPQTGPNSIADGLLTSLGVLNFELIQKYVSDILLATDPQIIAAMRLIYERMKTIIEPSCAVPLAALLANKARFKGKKVGIILSGGNVDLGKLPF